jgi:site-specific recombinase XerD
MQMRLCANVHNRINLTSDNKKVSELRICYNHTNMDRGGEVAIPAPYGALTGIGAVREYIRRSKAVNSVRAYDSDWRHFRAWCGLKNQSALPAAPEIVAAYLAELAAWARTSTVMRRVSAISQAHQVAGHESPARHIVVRSVLAGIRRTHGSAQAGKNPLRVEDLRRIAGQLPETAQGIRDRALLLAGFAGAFRRSELIGLDTGDLEFVPDGLVVRLRRSKTDQEGQGRRVGIPAGANPETCAVRAVSEWLRLIGRADGPVFRSVNRHGQIGEERLSDRAVALIVKRLAARAGLDARSYAGHSLRAGLATSAAAAGASERSIMAQTGHRDVGTARRYIREGSLFADNAAAKAGL